MVKGFEVKIGGKIKKSYMKLGYSVGYIGLHNGLAYMIFLFD